MYHERVYSWITFWNPLTLILWTVISIESCQLLVGCPFWTYHTLHLEFQKRPRRFLNFPQPCYVYIPEDYISPTSTTPPGDEVGIFPKRHNWNYVRLPFCWCWPGIWDTAKKKGWKRKWKLFSLQGLRYHCFPVWLFGNMFHTRQMFLYTFVSKQYCKFYRHLLIYVP